MLTYKITMSDGRRVDIMSARASDAIQRALEQCPGVKVESCYSGFKENHIVSTSVESVEYGPGWIDYEIPNHLPLNPEWVKAGRDKEDGTVCFGFMESVPVKKKSKRA